MRSLVSVVIPTYNRAHYLSEAIASALAQTHPAAEVIVVDDGSTDQTAEVCRGFPQVYYLHQPNQGVATARNCGIQASSGEYLLFLDSDDRLLSQAIEVGVQQLEAHPEVGLAFGLYHSIDAQGTRLPDRCQPIPDPANYASILDCRHLIPPAGALVRRSVIETVGGFNPAFQRGEDYELWLRIARTVPIHCHNQYVFEYRRHDTNLSSNALAMLEAELQVLQSQWSYICQNYHPEYESAYWRGRRFWLNLFGPVLPYQGVTCLKTRQWRTACRVFLASLRYYPQGFSQFGAHLLQKAAQRI